MIDAKQAKKHNVTFGYRRTIGEGNQMMAVFAPGEEIIVERWISLATWSYVVLGTKANVLNFLIDNGEQVVTASRYDASESIYLTYAKHQNQNRAIRHAMLLRPALGVAFGALGQVGVHLERANNVRLLYEMFAEPDQAAIGNVRAMMEHEAPEKAGLLNRAWDKLVDNQILIELYKSSDMTDGEKKRYEGNYRHTEKHEVTFSNLAALLRGLNAI